ncbi:MAG: signal transduction histidine kinase, partial [Comamonadaceae bacterium]
LQEAFTNIIKHTRATQIRVSTGSDAHGVQVTITDNGQGFDLQEARKRAGKGLSNQLRRAEAIGAVVDWKSSAEGTSLILSLPFNVPCCRRSRLPTLLQSPGRPAFVGAAAAAMAAWKLNMIRFVKRNPLRL